MEEETGDSKRCKSDPSKDATARADGDEDGSFLVRTPGFHDGSHVIF